MGETVQSLVAQAGGGGASLLGMLPFLVGMFAIMYFLMIRPERKRQAETQSMISALKKGDEIVLTSGIFAKIVSMEERFVVVEIADKTRIKILKQAVMGPASRFTAVPAAADGKKLGDTKTDDRAAAAPSGNPTAVSDDASDKNDKKSA